MYKFTNLSLIMAIFAIMYLGGTASAQSYGQTAKPFKEEAGDQALMTRAVLQKLTVWTRPSDNRPTYWAQCRYLSHGCEEQVATFVDYIFEVGRQENFDPWLLAGIAWHESRFIPFAESDAGASGIFQILRRSRWSRGLPFVRQHWYRQRCRRELGACQQPIVERAVYWLIRSINHCGSVQGGLRMYNSGRCDGPRRYTRAVFAATNDILERARVIRENGFVDVLRPGEGPIYYDDE